jgi:hypothetical protein
MGILLNKREVLQAIVDKEDDLWIIMKPSRNDPADPEDLCIFQSPARWKEARVEIPLSWFVNQELDKIERAVLEALERAQSGFQYT